MGMIVWGCNIIQSGTSGNFTYTAPTVVGTQADWLNRPVNCIDWGDAARFCNWMTNGQPTNLGEAANSTETGSYTLNGKTSGADLLTVTRNANAVWAIPTEDEWYKAAYYDPDKPGGARLLGLRHANRYRAKHYIWQLRSWRCWRPRPRESRHGPHQQQPRLDRPHELYAS